VRAPTGLERLGMWLRTSFARSDFSNLVSSPATMRLRPRLRAAPAADLWPAASATGQTPAHKSSCPLPHAASPVGLTLPCTFGWRRARRLDRSSRPDANAPRRPLMDARRVGQLPEKEPAESSRQGWCLAPSLGAYTSAASRTVGELGRLSLSRPAASHHSTPSASSAPSAPNVSTGF
jgi:hypothetical protein